jgi:CheY-like chemotaxis protein
VPLRNQIEFQGEESGRKRGECNRKIQKGVHEFAKDERVQRLKPKLNEFKLSKEFENCFNPSMNSLKRILLAEDNIRDMELTLAAFEENHLANEVVVVRDGAEALDYLNKKNKYSDRRDGHPAVVFLDLKMPKVDGLEVLRSMKSDPHLRTIPVVMLTSSREERDLVRSYELGVNAYVVKPVDFEQFAMAIKQLGFFWAVLNELPPQH